MFEKFKKASAAFSVRVLSFFAAFLQSCLSRLKAWQVRLTPAPAKVDVPIKPQAQALESKDPLMLESMGFNEQTKRLWDRVLGHTLEFPECFDSFSSPRLDGTTRTVRMDDLKSFLCSDSFIRSVVSGELKQNVAANLIAVSHGRNSSTKPTLKPKHVSSRSQ